MLLSLSHLTDKIMDPLHMMWNKQVNHSRPIGFHDPSLAWLIDDKKVSVPIFIYMLDCVLGRKVTQMGLRHNEQVTLLSGIYDKTMSFS